MSDGKQMEAIIAPASGVREPITEESLKMIEIGKVLFVTGLMWQWMVWGICLYYV